MASGVLSQNSVRTNVVGKAVARGEVDGICIVLVTCWTGARRAVGRVSREHGVVCAKVVRERSRKRSERKKEVFFRRVYTYIIIYYAAVVFATLPPPVRSGKQKRSVAVVSALPSNSFPLPPAAVRFCSLAHATRPSSFSRVSGGA